MRNSIDPNHLLMLVDEQIEPLITGCSLGRLLLPRFRTEIHPEVVIRALLICSLYNVSSFRRLCSAISGNFTHRWFCFPTIDAPVFDHSIISRFIDRIGRDGFAAVFGGLND